MPVFRIYQHVDKSLLHKVTYSRDSEDEAWEAYMYSNMVPSGEYRIIEWPPPGRKVEHKPVWEKI